MDIKQDKAVITIYDHASLTEIDAPKFRRLVKMALVNPLNDNAALRAEFLERLEHEKLSCESQKERLTEEKRIFCNWADNINTRKFCWGLDKIIEKYNRKHARKEKTLEAWAAKIEKYRGIVEAWDI